MALRRPPTRLDLKADDIDEYTKIMREKEMSMEDPMVMQHGATVSNGGTDGGRVKWSNMTPGTKKASAAQRIGLVRSYAVQP